MVIFAIRPQVKTLILSWDIKGGVWEMVEQVQPRKTNSVLEVKAVDEQTCQTAAALGKNKVEIVKFPRCRKYVQSNTEHVEGTQHVLFHLHLHHLHKKKSVQCGRAYKTDVVT